MDESLLDIHFHQLKESLSQVDFDEDPPSSIGVVEVVPLCIDFVAEVEAPLDIDFVGKVPLFHTDFLERVAGLFGIDFDHTVVLSQTDFVEVVFLFGIHFARKVLVPFHIGSAVVMVGLFGSAYCQGLVAPFRTDFDEEVLSLFDIDFLGKVVDPFHTDFAVMVGGLCDMGFVIAENPSHEFALTELALQGIYFVQKVVLYYSDALGGVIGL